MRGVLTRLLKDLSLHEYHLTLLRNGVTLSYEPSPDPNAQLLLVSHGEVKSYPADALGQAVDDFLELAVDPDAPPNEAGQPMGGEG